MGEGRSWNDSTVDSPKTSRIKLDQVAAEIEDINFQHMISTVENLAKFFKISTNAEGLERLITQLYKIKEKLDRGWIEILSLRAALIVFSINKDFTLKYDSENLIFSVYS